MLNTSIFSFAVLGTYVYNMIYDIVIRAAEPIRMHERPFGEIFEKLSCLNNVFEKIIVPNEVPGNY